MTRASAPIDVVPVVDRTIDTSLGLPIGTSVEAGVQAIRATWMRGGTSKGLFFAADDLPPGLLQRPGERDALLLRIIGSPDPFGRQTDGLGGATSSTSKVVSVSRSLRDDFDVEFLFGRSRSSARRSTGRATAAT